MTSLQAPAFPEAFRTSQPSSSKKPYEILRIRKGLSDICKGLLDAPIRRQFRSHLLSYPEDQRVVLGQMHYQRRRIYERRAESIRKGKRHGRTCPKQNSSDERPMPKNRIPVKQRGKEPMAHRLLHKRDPTLPRRKEKRKKIPDK